MLRYINVTVAALLLTIHFIGVIASYDTRNTDDTQTIHRHNSHSKSNVCVIGVVGIGCDVGYDSQDEKSIDEEKDKESSVGSSGNQSPAARSRPSSAVVQGDVAVQQPDEPWSLPFNIGINEVTIQCFVLLSGPRY